MSSSSVVSLSSFNLLFFTQVLTVLTSSIKYSEYVTDKGKNISIPCTAEGNVMWVKENGNSSTIIQTSKFLLLTNVSAADRGLYVCSAAVPTRNASATAVLDSTAVGAKAVGNTSSATTTTTTGKSMYSSSTATSLQPKVTTQTVIAATKAINASATIASTTSPLPMSTPTIAAASALDNSSQQTVDTDSVNQLPTDSAVGGQVEEEEQEYQAVEKVNVAVRTPPGPVTQLYFKASTILGFLIWRFNKTNSGGYPVRSFTAEFRNVSYNETPYNESFEHQWSRMDPINISPNVRQMEVYHLEPNTTYEFRIWANNHLGSGEVVTTNVTTLPETKEEDLIRLIQPDLDNFDPRIWIVAVSVVLGTLVILAIGLCIVLSKECYQSSQAGTDFNNCNCTTTATTTTTTTLNRTTARTTHTDNDCNLNVIVTA